MPTSISQPAAGYAPTAAAPSSRATVGLAGPCLALWKREIVRFFRQRNRVIGAFATPLVFWLLLGLGLNRTFTVPTPAAANQTAPTQLSHTAEGGVGYLEYFYPGTVILILLFTAIFSTITVIEDRREGFLQAVIVSPIPRSAIVGGKVLGGATIATIQGVVFLALWPVVGHWPGLGAMAAAVGVMFIVAAGLTTLGLCLAWPMDSTAGFHAVMNLFLMPMWFLSGAVFPLDTAPMPMRIIMYLNPLTYGQAAFAALLQGRDTPLAGAMPLGVSLVVTVGFTIAGLWLATRVVSKVRKDNSA